MPYKVHIHRTQVDNGKVTFEWALIHDPRLSGRAVGELLRLLAEPAADGSGKEGAPKRRGDGRDGTQAIHREWEAAGYLRRELVHGERGKIATILHVYDIPQVGPETDFPVPGRPGKIHITAGGSDGGFPGIGESAATSLQVGPETGFPAPVRVVPASPQAAPTTPYPASANPLPAGAASSHVTAGRADNGKPVAYLDLDREIDRSIWPQPGSPRDLLRQVEPTVDDTVVAEVVAILRQRGCRTPGGLLYTEIAAGRGPAIIAEARQRLTPPSPAARPGPSGSSPSPPAARELCQRCGVPGHPKDRCPTLADAGTADSDGGRAA